MCSRKFSGRVGKKLFLKNAGGQKNKTLRVGQRVGLDAVRLQYGSYVYGHLSKWFACCVYGIRLLVVVSFCTLAGYAVWPCAV